MNAISASPTYDPNAVIHEFIRADGNAALAAERLHIDLLDLYMLLAEPQNIAKLQAVIKVRATFAAYDVAKAAQEETLLRLSEMEPFEVAKTFIGALGELQKLITLPTTAPPGVAVQFNDNRQQVSFETAIKELPANVAEAIQYFRSKHDTNEEFPPFPNDTEAITPAAGPVQAGGGGSLTYSKPSSITKRRTQDDDDDD